MSSIFHQAFQQSTLAVSAAQNGEALEEFSYDLNKPMPSLYLDRHVEHKVSNLGFSDSASTELSSFGLLSNMYIKWKIKYTVGNGTGKVIIGKHPYANIIKRIALMNSSRELFQIYPENIIMKTKALPYGERERWLMAGEHDVQTLPVAINAGAVAANVGTQDAQSTANGDKTLTFFTRIPWSFMEGRFQSKEPLKTMLNLRFSEVTRVLIETNDAWKVVGGTDVSAQSIEECSVFCHYIIPSPEAMQRIEANNFSLDAPASYLYGNEIMNETTATVPAGATQHTHNVKIYNTNFTQGFTIAVHKQRAQADANTLSNNVATGASSGMNKLLVANAFDSTHVNLNVSLAHLINIASNRHHSVVAGGISRIGADFAQINKLVIKTSGRILFEATDPKQLLMTSTELINYTTGAGVANYRNMLDRNGCSDNNILYIPFSVLGNSNELSSGLSLRGLATLDLEVSFTCTESIVYVCKVITNYQQIVSLETTSGRYIASTSQ